MGEKKFNEKNPVVTLEEYKESLTEAGRVGMFIKTDRRMLNRLDRMAKDVGIQKTRLVIIAINRLLGDRR